MKVLTTTLPGVLIIEPRVFADDRGFFLESYSRRTFAEAGIACEFVQDNHSRSSHGVLRGLHYQLGQAQDKLVRVTSGRVFDVAADVRRGSPTFGRWVGVELSETNRTMLFVPRGFAHGFCVLSATADFLYKCSDYYAPPQERGVAWNDPDLAIEWPLDVAPVLSPRDAAHPRLASVRPEDLPPYTATAACAS